MLFIKTADGWKPWLPTCVPCPNSNDLQGVFQSEPIEKVQQELEPRISRFVFANGVGNMIEKQQYFRGDAFIVPLYGAYGEKL